MEFQKKIVNKSNTVQTSVYFFEKHPCLKNGCESMCVIHASKSAKIVVEKVTVFMKNCPEVIC